MASNHLETLVGEWYEFSGYFVRRNIQVGKRSAGGWECELDVVAFHPGKKHLIHLEPSADAHTWEKREARYRKKFEAGRKYIPALFAGLALPTEIEQVAILVFAGKTSRKDLGGGQVKLVGTLMTEIREALRDRRVNQSAVPEQYPLLRTLQFAAHYWT